MGSRITPGSWAAHSFALSRRVFTSAAKLQIHFVRLLCLIVVVHLRVYAQSSSGIAAKPVAHNARAASSVKEASVEVYHLGGKSGEIVIAGRAHKRAPAENLRVELAFRSEGGPVAITLPVKRLSPDTARVASFEFETSVHGLPQIAPNDPRHDQPFFAIHLTDRSGNRYYEEESYAQFISAEEKPVAVKPVIALPPQSLFAGLRKTKGAPAITNASAQAPAFVLKATRKSDNAYVLEWGNLPANSPGAQTVSILYRNEQHLAITFAKHYVDPLYTFKQNVKYRVEQIGKDGITYSSNTLEIPAQGARENSSVPALNAGGLYAAGAFVERTPEAIAAVVTKHNAAIQYCYQRELKRNSSLRGEVRVRIIVNARGSVDSVSIISSTLQSPAVEDCMVGRIKRWNDFGLSDPAKGEVAIKQTYVFGY
ncbi:AgmX/PglI C-terminal domain-containing protein [candidate division KSB1 bacterium]|nr:AgmX/PglI C-terminal domain-containing protein [candidate division KSB1 bacterium]